MKKLLFLSIMLFNLITFAQPTHNNTDGELNTETPTSKFVQGAFTAGIINLSTNSFNRGKDKWLTYLISIGGSLVLEGLLNSKNTNLEKMTFVATGAVSVNVTIEIFRSKTRRKYCNY